MSRYPTIDLNGAVVAITGGARGIGRACAEAFIARGSTVAIGDRELDLAEHAAAEIGASAHFVDVADREAFAAFLAEVESLHGGLDVLVNNAGVMPNGAFVDEDPRTSRMTMDVNVFGLINGMQLVLPGMTVRGRGHIVNVASLAGKVPIKGLAVYNASKFAAVGLTAAVRLEAEPAGVSVSAILPSAVDTDLASGLDMRPIPKVRPEQIADAVVDSVRTRRAETNVPRYVGVLANVASLTPEPALRLFRSLIKDDRALHADPERAAYEERLASHAAPQTPAASRRGTRR